MPNDETTRGYELPHPKNIASSDVIRIRNSIKSIDEDICKIWNQNTKQKLENIIELWN